MESRGVNMLDKIIMLPFSMFIFFLFAFLSVIGVIMFGQWTMVQNEAQFVASSMGKWGGYTSHAEDIVDRFADKVNLSRNKIKVDVSDVGPIPWGQPIEARITVPFNFELGDYKVGTYNLTGVGHSVSSNLGAYSGISYIHP